MTGLPYDDDINNYPWSKAPITTEQREDYSPTPLPTNMDIDDLPKASTDVNMSDAVAVKPWVYNPEDGDVQQRTGKVHGRYRSRHESRLGRSRSRSPLREASVPHVHDGRANKSSGEEVVVPETDEQRQVRIEEAKAAANSDGSKPEDENGDDLAQNELGEALMAELENPTDEKAPSPDPTGSATPAALHLATSREELNDERCRSLMSPVIAPDRESLRRQVCLLRERTRDLEQRLQDYEQGSNSVVVDQQREIEQLHRKLDEVKNWAEDGPLFQTMYQNLKARNEKLEDELDEAIAARQAAIDEKDDLLKVIESMREWQLNSPVLPRTVSHESQSAAAATSSVLQSVAPDEKFEIRKFGVSPLNQQSSDEADSDMLTDKSPNNSDKKKRAASCPPKANQKTKKLEADLAAAQHQLSGCHKKTRIHKRLIWELQNKVTAFTDAHTQDLQTIDSLTEQLTESQAQTARLEAKGNAKDILVRGLRETNNALKDQLTASRIEAKELTATVENLNKDNRALTVTRSDPARYELEIAALKNALQEAKVRELKLQESLDLSLEVNKTTTDELDQLRKTYDEEAIYRNRAIARKNENADLRATAVPRAELTAVEAENVRLEKANADLIAERDELKTETAYMINALDYAHEKIETISRAGPPATLPQQRTMYAGAVAGAVGKSERAKAMREVKQILAEQREESFRAMRLSLWNIEEEWKEEFGMAGPYCKPMGDRSMLRSVAIAG